MNSSFKCLLYNCVDPIGVQNMYVVVNKKKINNTKNAHKQKKSS